jgi:hypothetical protein
MNLGIVVDREPTLEIKWKESGQSLCMKRGKDKVNREQMVCRAWLEKSFCSVLRR